MRLETTFIADVHKVKGVEYLDRTTGRMATSWRLILDYGDDTGEIKCVEDVAKNVKRHTRYRFIATVDPSTKETSFRITGIAECLGYPDDPFDDENVNNNAGSVNTYVQAELAAAGLSQQTTAAGVVGKTGTSGTDANTQEVQHNQDKAPDAASSRKASK